MSLAADPETSRHATRPGGPGGGSVAIDLRWLQQSPRGGVGRSLAQVLPHLVSHATVTGLTDAGWPPLTAAEAGCPVVALRTPPPGLASVWLQWSAVRWLRGSRFDGVFHCPWYALPSGWRGPTVVTLHDVAFEHRPAWYGRGKLASYRAQGRFAARTAGAILTVSEHVKADIVATYAVDPDRVLVARHGVDPVFRPCLDPAGEVRAAGVTGGYVVALGGAERRNLPLAVEAWRQARTGLPLVVVGPPEPVPADVVHLGPLPDPAWAATLAGAAAFLYPTAYEGYGMPATEALAAGTPVVAAPVGALPEVLGDDAAWSRALTPSDLAAALRRALDDGDRLRAAGLARVAAAPGWEQAADVHLQAYARAAGRPG